MPRMTSPRGKAKIWFGSGVNFFVLFLCRTNSGSAIQVICVCAVLQLHHSKHYLMQVWAQNRADSGVSIITFTMQPPQLAFCCNFSPPSGPPCVNHEALLQSPQMLVCFSSTNCAATQIVSTYLWRRSCKALIRDAYRFTCSLHLSL
jgi:hypothetical protein